MGASHFLAILRDKWVAPASGGCVDASDSHPPEAGATRHLFKVLREFSPCKKMRCALGGTYIENILGDMAAWWLISL